MSEYVLSMEKISKIYSNGFLANKDIDFYLKKGEIHALVGENGAGKSTLMKILFGVETPDSGKIFLNGKEIKIDSPMSAINFGIGMVHQHFMLAPSLSVAENIIMGIEPTKMGMIDYGKAIKMCEDASKKYNLVVDPRAKVQDLPVGIKQKIEILKSLLRGAEILILDEPTAVLTPQETEELFVQLKKLRKNGHTIIFISHKLKEVKSLCDRITVLKQGKSMGMYDINKLSEKDISRLMVGRDVILKVDKEKAQPKDVVLKVRNLEVKNNNSKAVVKNLSLDIRKGEILGIAGIEGNGQREFAESITGMEVYSSGNIFINDINIKDKTILEIRELGTGYIPEDRMIYGIAPDVSIKENIISDRFYKKEYNKNLMFNLDKINSEAEYLIKQYLIKCDDKDQPIRMLSGGNIQKVVVARECSSKSSLIIINQPTRGVDVGAIEFIRKHIIKLRDEGKAILLVSADLNEILELSDSIAVMNDGQIVGYFKDSSAVTEQDLGEYMLGIKRMSEDDIKGVIHEK
ncbi:MAG: ABC transporter ATP-binding protein [Filifactoraceae bacterium]